MEPDCQTLLRELFEHTPRQAPGSVQTTRRALGALSEHVRIERVLDLGCGTGGSTLELAEQTGAHVTAVDLYAPFLAILRARAERRGLGERIATVAADMANASALGSDFDLVWSEGSAYSIGFENALRRWRPLLRPRGCLVVTELVWFVPQPDPRARAFFASEYPDMRDERTRVEHACGAGFERLDSFRLPAEDWRVFYADVESALREAIARRGRHEIDSTLRRECELYDACGHEYGYLCLVLQATPASTYRSP